MLITTAFCVQTACSSGQIERLQSWVTKRRNGCAVRTWASPNYNYSHLTKAANCLTVLGIKVDSAGVNRVYYRKKHWSTLCSGSLFISARLTVNSQEGFKIIQKIFKKKFQNCFSVFFCLKKLDNFQKLRLHSCFSAISVSEALPRKTFQNYMWVVSIMCGERGKIWLKPVKWHGSIKFKHVARCSSQYLTIKLAQCPFLGHCATYFVFFAVQQHHFFSVWVPFLVR